MSPGLARLILDYINDSTLLAPGDRVQRPKVFYQDDQFHVSPDASRTDLQMWFASDNSSLIKLQGYATSPNITGPYTYQGSFRPFGDGWSSDYGQFRDYKTGQMYAVYAGGFNGSVSDDIIATFNEQGDGLQEIVYDFKGTSFEGPTIVQTDQSYWFVGSHKTGYRPNNVIAMRSDALTGPWSQPNLIAPRDTRTFSSQSGFNFRIAGSKQTTHIYMGDRWSSPRIWDSRLLWLPIQIDEEEKSLSLEWYDVYHLDAKTGEWWPIEGTTYFSKDAAVAGDAFHQEANFGSNLTIVTGIYGNDSTVTFNVKGCGKKQWVSFWYQNTDDVDYGDNPGSGNYTVERISSVIVNGDTSNIETLVQLDTWKGVLLSTPLELDLADGDNTITIGGLWNGDDYKGADIDRIVVYPPED